MTRPASPLALSFALASLLGGCDKESSSPSAPPSSSDVSGVRAELQSELAEAKVHVAAKHLDKLHEPAGHIWALAAKLRAAKAPYGRLFRLARDLDTQGDAGNAPGVADVMAALEKEIANPSSPDVPDDGAPLVAEEHGRR